MTDTTKARAQEELIAEAREGNADAVVELARLHGRCDRLCDNVCAGGQATRMVWDRFSEPGECLSWDGEDYRYRQVVRGRTIHIRRTTGGVEREYTRPLTEESVWSWAWYYLRCYVIAQLDG